MAVTWKINGVAAATLGFSRLVLRLVNQLVDTLTFEDTGAASSVEYSVAPTVTISGGGGTGATATATVAGGIIDALTLTAGGSGFTSTPSVSFSGSGSASAVARLATTNIASVALTNVGSGYTSAPTVTVEGGGGTGAAVTAALAPRGVGGVTLLAGGTGYTTAPTVSFTGGGGTGASALAVLSGGAVESFTLTNGGTGYTSAPTISFSGGGGIGAAATAVLASRGVASVAVTAAGSYAGSRSTVVAFGDITYSTGAACDSSGNLYVSDYLVGEVYKVTPGGVKTVFATISGAGGLAFDSSGNLYVATLTAPGKVWKVTSGGTVTSLATLGNFYGTLAIDASGNLYAGGSAGVISKITPAGVVTTFATIATSVAGMAFSAAGDLYVSSGGSVTTLRKITPAGSVSAFGTVTSLGAMAFGPDGNIYGSYGGDIIRVSPAGVQSSALDGFALVFIYAVAFDSSGNLFVTEKDFDTDDGQVTKVSGLFPTVSLVSGGGSGATARAVMAGLNTFTISSFEVTAAGSGFTSAPTVTVTGTGTGTATLTNAAIASVTLTNGGNGYTSAPTVVFTGGGGTGAAATANIAQTVWYIYVTAPGSGYTSTPTVTLTGGGGTGALAISTLEAGALASLTVTSPGSGFTSTPVIVISGGGGSGALATATLAPSAVASLELIHPGGPYLVNTEVVLTRDVDGVDTTWFRGFVRQPPKVLTPGEELRSYEVEGPWQWLERLPYLQNFNTPVDPDDTESALETYLRGRAILAQSDAGAKISVKTFLEQVITYAAEAIETKYGDIPFTGEVGATLDVTIPWDEVTDLSCADVISRVLQLVPDAVCWFDYAENPPVLHIDRRQALAELTLPIVPPGGVAEYGAAVRNRVELTPLPKLQREGVVLIYVATHRTNGAGWETYEIDRWPVDAIPNDPDVLVRTIQLAGAISQVSLLKQVVDVDPIPSALVFSGRITSGASYDSVRTWWRNHAPELRGSNVTIVSFSTGSQTLADGTAVSGDCPRELVKGGVTDWMEDSQGILVEDQLIKVTVEMEIVDPLNAARKERVKKDLVVPIKATNAQTQTYTFTVGGSYTPPEEVPEGLARAIFDAISPMHHEGEVVLVEREASVRELVGRTLNLTGDEAAWETMAALVQRAVIDLDQGTTRLQVGPPRQLGVGDLMELFRVNRTRPVPTSYETRTTGRSGAAAEAQGLARHSPATKVAGTQRRDPRILSVALTMAGAVPTSAEITTALQSAYDAGTGNTPVQGDVVHLTRSSVPKLSYRVTLSTLTASGLNVVAFTVDSVSYRGWLTQIGIF